MEAKGGKQEGVCGKVRFTCAHEICLLTVLRKSQSLMCPFLAKIGPMNSLHSGVLVMVAFLYWYVTDIIIGKLFRDRNAPDFGTSTRTN